MMYTPLQACQLCSAADLQFNSHANSQFAPGMVMSRAAPLEIAFQPFLFFVCILLVS